jgi:hypothetical protein
MAIWHNFVLIFGTFSPFWYVVLRKIWQPCAKPLVCSRWFQIIYFGLDEIYRLGIKIEFDHDVGADVTTKEPFSHTSCPLCST